MKKWKKILHNCPYLVVLSATWLFLTIGGLLLVRYRDYGEMKWQDMLSNPFFAVVMEKEVQKREAQPVLAENNEKTDVIEKEGAEWEENNSIKLNLDIIKFPPDEENAEDKDSGRMPERFQENAQPAGLDKLLKMELPQAAETEINASGQGREIEEKEISDTTAGLEEAESPSESTRFITYTPIETDSIYYSDAGRIALTTDYEYRKVNETYFTDAAFIGDSRTLGISDYAGLDADFYCENGMTVYKLFDEKGITWQRNGQKVNLDQVLQQKQYGKIYIMLGMNELGYGDTEKYLEQYRNVVEQIREWQPQAVIFILANLHVSKEKNSMETEFNNVNINDKNAASASLADGVNVFYLDSNPIFTDVEGFLKDDLTFDGVHLYANNYESWKKFFMEHGVVKNGNRSTGNAIK